MSIRQIADGWALETKSTAYVFGLNSGGMLIHRYWGARLPGENDYPPAPSSAIWLSFNGPGQLAREEYPAWGGQSFVEPRLKATFSTGVRDVVLNFESATIGENRDGVQELRLRLSDKHYPLVVDLFYRAHEEYDLIERWAVVTNLGTEPILLERAWSCLWHLPLDNRYRLSHVSGRCLNEMQLHRESLAPGKKVIESRRLTTSHHAKPWFAVDRGNADEESGEVWFGTLAWSGNWKLVAETTDFGSTRIGIGVNDWDFAWRLDSKGGASSSLVLPACVAGWTEGGFGAASRALHDYVRGELLPHRPALHPVLYNSWEATYYDVDAPSQTKLATIAAGMGVELFVVDDGWFQGRKTDNAGLGDWRPDERKFPQGLGPLIQKVNALGMGFGLWVEPEMVNPDSDLYRAHPDWVIHFPTRARTEGRNQLILNCARLDVQEHLIATLDKLLSENNIAFIKWDMNRNVSEPGWPGAPGDPRELWVRYVQGLYRIWGTLRERHPTVTWQSCAGGDARADFGILRLADQIWPSDNTLADSRLAIQEGFSQFFPANVMEAWVTDAARERLSLEFRFHVSMCGALGVGCDLNKLSAEELRQAAQLIAMYKEIRPIVQLGHQYRLRSAQQSPFSAVQYVSSDCSAGVLFAFRTHIAGYDSTVTLPALFLRGLQTDWLYEVEGFSGARSGAAWMRVGLRIELKDFQSTIRRIHRV